MLAIVGTSRRKNSFRYFETQHLSLLPALFAKQCFQFDSGVNHRWTASQLPIAPSPLVLTGPSGSGKSTLLKRLMEEFQDCFGFSISRKLFSLQYSFNIKTCQ